MIKRRLKYKYITLIIGLFVLFPALTLLILTNKSLSKDTNEPDYVNESIINDSLPVINATKKIIKPYVDEEVTIGKTFYDYQGEEESQINSIILHDNTYMQNTGTDYVNKNTFDVVAILEGTVINVKDDETVGKTIEIKHENGYVSIYQSLSETSVKKGELVSQGQVIGKSGTNELDKDLGNHLHFEIYDNGQAVNPENYLNKEISTTKEN